MKAKNIFSYILILAIFATSISKSLIVADFELNRDYFAKELCIKKDIPDNCCKGSCQLQKELKQDDSSDNSVPAQNILKFELTGISEPIDSALYYNPICNNLLFSNKLNSIVDKSFSVFHPPCC